MQLKEKTRAIQTKLISRKKSFKKFLDLGRRLGQNQKQGEDRMSNRTRQNNNGADRKMESNDSPNIPDRGETSEEPGLPSGHTNVNVHSDEQKQLY